MAAAAASGFGRRDSSATASADVRTLSSFELATLLSGSEKFEGLLASGLVMPGNDLHNWMGSDKPMRLDADSTLLRDFAADDGVTIPLTLKNGEGASLTKDQFIRGYKSAQNEASLSEYRQIFNEALIRWVAGSAKPTAEHKAKVEHLLRNYIQNCISSGIDIIGGFIDSRGVLITPEGDKPLSYKAVVDINADGEPEVHSFVKYPSPTALYSGTDKVGSVEGGLLATKSVLKTDGFHLSLSVDGGVDALLKCVAEVSPEPAPARSRRGRAVDPAAEALSAALGRDSGFMRIEKSHVKDALPPDVAVALWDESVAKSDQRINEWEDIAKFPFGASSMLLRDFRGGLEIPGLFFCAADAGDDHAGDGSILSHEWLKDALAGSGAEGFTEEQLHRVFNVAMLRLMDGDTEDAQQANLRRLAVAYRQDCVKAPYQLLQSPLFQKDWACIPVMRKRLEFRDDGTVVAMGIMQGAAKIFENSNPRKRYSVDCRFAGAYSLAPGASQFSGLQMKGTQSSYGFLMDCARYDPIVAYVILSQNQRLAAIGNAAKEAFGHASSPQRAGIADAVSVAISCSDNPTSENRAALKAAASHLPRVRYGWRTAGYVIAGVLAAAAVTAGAVALLVATGGVAAAAIPLVGGLLAAQAGSYGAMAAGVLGGLYLAGVSLYSAAAAGMGWLQPGTVKSELANSLDAVADAPVVEAVDGVFAGGPVAVPGAGDDGVAAAAAASGPGRVPAEAEGETDALLAAGSPVRPSADTIERTPAAKEGGRLHEQGTVSAEYAPRYVARRRRGGVAKDLGDNFDAAGDSDGKSARLSGSSDAAAASAAAVHLDGDGVRQRHPAASALVLVPGNKSFAKIYCYDSVDGQEQVASPES